MKNGRPLIVIPNYNGADYLPRCLDALALQSLPCDILVVDNGSTDESAEVLAKRKEIRTLNLPENTGFTGAVNAGIAEAGERDYVILLNNDTEAAPDFAKELVLGMERHDDAFSGQARMLSMDDPTQIDDAGDFYCLLGWAFRRGLRKKDRDIYRKERRIFSACGGAAIYDLAFLRSIGGFDDLHFAYLEDTDVGYRARLAGRRNYYFPKAVVLHKGSAASGSLHNDFKVRLTARNTTYLAWKNMPLLQWVVNMPFLLFGHLIKALFFTKKGLGTAYREGFSEGFRFIGKGRKEGKKCRFSAARIPRYLAIEGELILNCARRILWTLGS